MNILELELKDLKPYDKNPRKNDDAVDYVANSIKEFGFKVPIVIDKDYVIVAGHTRYKAAKRLNIKRVPCIVADDLTPEQIKAYRLADNKVAEKAEWDFDLLNEELTELLDFDFEMTPFGFDDVLQDEEPQEIIEDEVPEVDMEAEPIAKLGDIWQLGNHRLMCGDSTDSDSVAKLMNGAKADMVFTDPPYGMNLDTDYSGMKNKLDFAKEKGFTGGKNYNQGIVDDFNPKMIELILSLNVKETFLWGADYYAELLNNKNDGSCFELCWSKNKHKRDIARVKWAGVFGTEKEFDHKRHHPTQKPIKLCEWFLTKYSNENDIVLDLFGGSGSTLIACEQLNRQCYMMELDPHYVDVIVKRWETLTGGKAVLLNESH